MKDHPEFFSGIYDNRTTGQREIWKDGRLCRYAKRNAVGTSETQWRELHAPWGAYPDHPNNAEIAA